MLVRRLGQGLQGPGVHAGVVGRGAVAPAVGEGLDGVGLVGGDLLDRQAGALGRVHPAGGGLVGPVGAMAARRAHPRDEVDVRRGQRPQPRPARREAFRLLVEVVHRRHARGQVGVGDLRRHGWRPGRGPVGMEVEQPRDQRRALGVDDAGALGRLDLGTDRQDPPILDHQRPAIGGRAGGVEDLGVDHRQRLGLGDRQGGRERRGAQAAEQDSGGTRCHGIFPNS